VSSFIKNAGGFNLDEKSMNSELFRSVVDGYVFSLMKNNQLVELYLEQRRSRSGKIQAPNEALFDHIISVYFNTIGTTKKDVIFVPVTINYDRVIEAEAFPLELLGESVRRDTPFKILKQLIFAKKQVGKVMIRYGQPQSLQENITKYLLKNNLTATTLVQKPELQKFSKKLSEEMSYCLVDNLIVMNTSLIATALLMHRRGISLDLLD